MADTAMYGASKRGNRTLIFRGFEFCHHRVLKNGNVVWRCNKRERCKCKATVVADGLRVVSNLEPHHSHEGNNSSCLARRAVGEMKLRLVDTLATPAGTQATVTSTLPNHVLMALPKKTSLARILRRHRQQVHLSEGEVMPPIPTDTDFVMPARFKDFVLYDSGPGSDRIILLGCNELMDALARASLWLADGTFKVVPSIFFQLYTIHFQFVPGINPAALYCIVTDKTRGTYDRILDQLLIIIPTAAPTVILTDFESAAMGAFRARFPNARISGCYFHLAQSILRKVNEVGLKREYETRDDIRISLRCLAALSHVPVDDVPEAFDELAESMPAAEHVDEVLTYFEHTYVRGRRLRGRGDNYAAPLFAIATWNQMEAAADGIARTNNICEGWHHGLQSLLQCSHPTMWRFLDGLSSDCVKQKTALLQGVSGVSYPGEKRYRDLRERVQRAVASYGQTDVLTYLRAIAHLSYS